MDDQKQRIARYYDSTVNFYRLFWHGRTGAVHYGLADDSTTCLADELLNTNQFLADAAGITEGDAILDAGCGVGGSSIWLRERFDVQVMGITLSSKQARIARGRAASKQLPDIRFEVRDFLDTELPDESFDVVWAIESVCHAEDKEAFLREAVRLLRPGGRVVVADGLQLRAPRSDNEKTLLDQFLRGLLLPNLSSPESFSQDMESVGLSDVTHWDKTENALPSARRLHRMCRLGYPLSRITEKLHLTPPILTANNLAGIAQLELVESGVLGYGVFFGRKD